MSNGSNIQIKIGTVEVQCAESIDPDQLGDILRTLKSELAEFCSDDAPTARRGLRELLTESSARTFGEKAGVVAYWLEQECGRAQWRTGDIADALREAGEAEPANLTDTLNQKLKKGLFETQDRRWSLTGEGRGWVKYRLLNHTEDGD